MMLRDHPATVASNEDPSHTIWTEIVTVGEINMAGGDHYVFGNLTDQQHRIGFHSDTRGAPAEIIADGLPAILQFIDRAEQDSVLTIEFHVTIKVLAVERFNPLDMQAFNGRCCGHANASDKRERLTSSEQQDGRLETVFLSNTYPESNMEKLLIKRP